MLYSKIQFILSYAALFAGTLLLALWVSRIWQKVPAPMLLRCVRHSQNLWFALGLSIAPHLIGQFIIGPLLFRNIESEVSPVIEVLTAYVFPAFFGVLYGLAASCCAAPVKKDAPFKMAHALTIGCVLIVVSHFSAYLPASRSPLGVLLVIIPFAIVVTVARLVVTRGSASKESSEWAHADSNTASESPSKTWPWIVIFRVLAIVPTFAAPVLTYIYSKVVVSLVFSWVFVASLFFCPIVGCIGISTSMKSVASKILVVFLGIGLGLFNLLLAMAAGCSGGGRYAP